MGDCGSGRSMGKVDGVSPAIRPTVESGSDRIVSDGVELESLNLLEAIS